MNQQVNVGATQAAQSTPGEDEIEGEGWTFHDGRVSQGERHSGIGPNGIEGLSYNNPFGQGMEEYGPIWPFYYVLVPRDYTPNTLRSARDCEGSGNPVPT